MAEQFDPRFDPAFQPGYDPKEHARPRQNDPPSSVSDFDSTSSHGEPDLHRPEVTNQGAPGAVDPYPVEANPFERALWVVAAVLVVVGAAAAFWANSVNFNSPGSVVEWQQILQSSAWSLSAPMITVGLGAGVALIFRRALAWDVAAEEDAVGSNEPGVTS